MLTNVAWSFRCKMPFPYDPPLDLSLPLTRREIRRLVEFLDSKPEAMGLEEIDGFFTALIWGTQLIPPSEYLQYVWGRDVPQSAGFADLQEAQEILGFLMSHWNTIAGSLSKNHIYYPSLLEDAGGFRHGNDWAAGFIRGMHLREDSWIDLVKDEERYTVLVPIMTLAHERDPKPEPRPDPYLPIAARSYSSFCQRASQRLMRWSAAEWHYHSAGYGGSFHAHRFGRHRSGQDDVSPGRTRRSGQGHPEEEALTEAAAVLYCEPPTRVDRD